MFRYRYRFAGSAISAVLLSATLPVTAQESTTAAGRQKLTTDEIVVTARKREESLQDVPFSITALSADQLQRVGASDNEDIALLTPNFNTVRQIGRRLDRPTIRGQSAAAVGGEPNASYFIDGVAVAGSIATVTLGPIERVEILRGPQSAQFGRATFAGAINYVTRKPTDEFTGEVSAKVGEHETKRFSAWVSGPVVADTLRFFAAAGYSGYGGEWRNNLQANQAPADIFENRAPLVGSPPQGGDSSPLGGTESKDAQLKLLLTPTDRSELTVKFGYTEGRDDHYPQLLQEPGELNCFLPTDGSNGTVDNTDEVWFTTSKGQFCGTFDPDAVRYVAENPFAPINPGFDYLGYFPGGVVGGVNALVDGLPAQGGPRQARLNLPDIRTGMALPDGSLFPEAAQIAFFGRVTQPEDWLATPERVGTFRQQRRYLIEYVQDSDFWTSTARFAYNEDDLEQGNDLDRTEQRYLNGLFTNYAVDHREDYSFELRMDSPADERLRGSVGAYYFDSELESSTKRFVGIGGFAQFEPPLQRDTENVALFSTLEYDISDTWTVSGEARWARDEKTIEAQFSCTDVGDPNFGRQARDEQTTNALTPRLTVRYQPDDDLMLYALAAKGNKPAEFNSAYFRVATGDGCETAAAIDAGVSQIKEEKAWTYETGVKKNWLDGRITTNLSVFFINWRNQSVFQVRPVNGVLTQITGNAGKSEVFGLELETSYVMTDFLTGRFSYGLADGKFVRYNDSVIAETTGVGLMIDPLTNQPMRINGSLVFDESANNAKGNRLPSSPKHSFILALDYQRPTSVSVLGIDNLEWFARTDFVFESDRYSSATNYIKFPNRKLLNMRIGIDQPTWTLTVYGANLLDDQTPTAIFGFEVIGTDNLGWQNGFDSATNLPDGSVGRSPNMNSYAPPPGRQVGLEWLYRFGN